MPETRPQSWPCFARHVIEYVARRQDPSVVPPPPMEIAPHGGVFVTLRKFARLRGCMGLLDPSLPLDEAVRHAAQCAAAEDPRFPPVAPDELQDIHVEVSIMSAPRPMQHLDELEIGRHGIIVQQGRRRGLFLPQVAVDHHLDKEAFLSRCCNEKAGLAPDAWKHADTTVEIFTTEVHDETHPA